MYDEKEKRPQVGDVGYKGGRFVTRAYVNGKNVEVVTYKDPDGNVTSVFTRDLILGIF